MQQQSTLTTTRLSDAVNNASCLLIFLLVINLRLFLKVAIDIEFAKNQFELHRKVNPAEVIVGWLVLITVVCDVIGS